MNRPLQHTREAEPSTAGTPEAYLDDIAEALALAAEHAHLGTRYAAMGGGAGLRYSVKAMIAHAKAAATLLVEMEALRAEQARRRQDAQ